MKSTNKKILQGFSLDFIIKLAVDLRL